jgi:hypothetical protein
LTLDRCFLATNGWVDDFPLTSNELGLKLYHDTHCFFSLRSFRMSMYVAKPLSALVSLSLILSGPAFAQQQPAPAGAGAASGAAVGGVTVGAVGAAVAVVAAAAALSGGSSGSAASASGSATSAATSSSTAASQARTANTAATAAVNQLSGLAGFGALNDTLRQNAIELQGRAENAASDLAVANTAATSGVINPITGNTVCAAATTCTAAEKLLLGYEAARLAKAAVEATLVYIAAVETAALSVTNKNVTAYATGTAALASAYAAALLAQTAANDAITSYNALATALGLTGTTIAASSGTTGSIGASGTVSFARGSQ